MPLNPVLIPRNRGMRSSFKVICYLSTLPCLGSLRPRHLKRELKGPDDASVLAGIDEESLDRSLE